LSECELTASTVLVFASMQAQRLFGQHVYLAVKASDAIKAAGNLTACSPATGPN